MSALKKHTIEIIGELGDPIYWIEKPDYFIRHEKIMKFKVGTDRNWDYIDMIGITAAGLKYYYDCGNGFSEVTSDELGFISKSDANRFIKQYCTGFNAKKYKFNTPIYTEYGVEKIESADIDNEHNIFFRTDKKNEYYISDENVTFSFGPEFTQEYILLQLSDSDVKVIGKYTGRKKVQAALLKIKKKVTVTTETEDSFSYTKDNVTITIKLVSTKKG